MNIRRISVMSLVMATAVLSARASDYPSLTQPGQARVATQGQTIMLENNLLQLTVSRQGGGIRPTGFTNSQTNGRLGHVDSEFFHVTVEPESDPYPCSQFVVQGKCNISRIAAKPKSRTLAKRSPGVRIEATMLSPDKRFTVDWSVELRDGANYIRQFATIRPQDKPVRITSIQFFDMGIEQGRVAGTVPGSPIIAGDFFIAYEHPNAENVIFDPSMAENLAYRKPVRASGVFGAMAPEIAVDGNFDVNAYWGCQNTPVWLAVDLGKAIAVNKIKLVTWYNNRRYYGYRIESSTDGAKWQTLIDASDNKAVATSAGYVHQIDERSVRYIKVTITSNSEGGRFGGHIVELQVFGPESKSVADASQRAVCRLDRDATLRTGESLRQSAVLGVVPRGQLRRGFLYYVERERVAPYHPFLHYNSWYDIAWGARPKMNSEECVEVINAYGSELIIKRGVKMDSLVFDDGWDDPKTLWQIIEKNFPEGFTPLRRAADTYGTELGVWLSPWGGYGKAKADRIAYGKTQGFEIAGAGFSLAGPKYFKRFRESCIGFVNRYNVNFFKFDGTDAKLLAETEALLRLCHELYSASDQMYISITTGTWASPFWLLHADSVWRGGGDMGFYGPGAKREQWLSYRDKITYQNMVTKGPLYPLNSFMNQGIAHAIWGAANLPAEAEEFAHEVWSFFGIGTSLQELYISPSRMTTQMWDILAEGAKWSRENSDILVDTHWIGGDPGKLQVYGCASWRGDKGIFMLRNPDEKKQKITVDISEAFELPGYAKTRYTFESPRSEDRGKPALVLQGGTGHTFELDSFEVIVFESTKSE